MSKKPTVRDIAKHANVAISTVSQVLNNKPGVAPDTRARVLTAASDLGYRQRVFLNTPITPQIKTIALLMKHYTGDPIAINPFYSYVLAGAERECARHNGVGLMYANIQVDIQVDENSRAESLPSIILNHRVDGAIIVGTFLKETIREISRNAGRNVVLVDSYVSGEYSDMLDSVLIDNYRSAYNAVSHLIENGHRHIGLIGSHPDSYPSIAERRDGYINALTDNGIVETYIEDSLLEPPSAYDATRRLMHRHPQITAIFACNDNVALGVMNALHAMGYDIPGDVSVMGFDDIDLAQELTPALTTVHVDKVLLGAMAVRVLLDRSQSPDRPGMTTTLGTQLILRDSVRRLTPE